tara:strand:- start:831 stop:1472 length:642 start_codon:yes stop_codon:yes gene_type:complete
MTETFTKSNSQDQLKIPTIDTFRGQFAELARPNLFQVSLSLPDEAQQGLAATSNATQTTTQDASGEGRSTAELSRFMVKASSFPASTVGVVEVPFRGRQLKIAGDRTFEPWSVTVLNDEQFSIRRKLETWAQAIQEYRFNSSSAGRTSDYMGNAKVEQISRAGKPIKAVIIEGIWPSNISALDLDWGTNDTPEEYTVEFQVQYWYPSNADAPE